MNSMQSLNSSCDNGNDKRPAAPAISRAESADLLPEVQMTPQKRSRKGWQKVRGLLNPGRRQSYVAEMDEGPEEPDTKINDDKSNEMILLGFENSGLDSETNSHIAIVSESVEKPISDSPGAPLEDGTVSNEAELERTVSLVKDAESSTNEILPSTGENVTNVPDTAPNVEPVPSLVPVTQQESLVQPHEGKAEEPLQSDDLQPNTEAKDSNSGWEDEYDDPTFKRISTSVFEALEKDRNNSAVSAPCILTLTKPANDISTGENSEPVSRSARFVPTLPPTFPRGNRRYITVREIVQWENDTETGLANWEKELSQEISLQRELTMLDAELDLALKQKDALERSIDEARLYKETTSDPKILELIKENQRLTDKLVQLGIPGVSSSLLGVANELYNHVNMPAAGRHSKSNLRDALHTSLLNFLNQKNRSVAGSESSNVDTGRKKGGGERRRHRMVQDVGIGEENANILPSVNHSRTHF